VENITEKASIFWSTCL